MDWQDDPRQAPMTKRSNPSRSNGEWDVLIVGGGPAGLSAALVLARACRRVLVCDQGLPRNRHSRQLHGFITRDGTAPAELLEQARRDLAGYPEVDLRLLTEIVAVRQKPGGYSLTSAAGEEFGGRKLLMACGVRDTLPDLPGAGRFYGRSLFHCPYCDAYEHRGRRLVAFGRGASAYKLALELTGWSRDVVLVTNGPSEIGLRRRQRLAGLGIALREEPVDSLHGADGVLERIEFRSGGPEKADALFFPSSGQASFDAALRLGAAGTRRGTAHVGRYGKTRTPGLFVAGDAARHVQMAILAAGEGAATAFAINAELLRDDLQRA